MRKVIFGVAALVAGLVVACATTTGATQEHTDITNAPYPQWVQPGMYVGQAGGQVPNSTVTSSQPFVVLGDAGVSGNLVVQGTVTQGTGAGQQNAINGDLTVNGDAGVAGATTLTGNVTIAGQTTFTGGGQQILGPTGATFELGAQSGQITEIEAGASIQIGNFTANGVGVGRSNKPTWINGDITIDGGITEASGATVVDFSASTGAFKTSTGTFSSASSIVNLGGVVDAGTLLAGGGLPALLFEPAGSPVQACQSGTATLSSGVASRTFSPAFSTGTPVCICSEATTGNTGGNNRPSCVGTTSTIGLDGGASDVLNWICCGVK